jgi:hypothetical protein
METIEISKKEYKELIEAYKKITAILGKSMSRNEIYTEDLLQSLDEAEEDIRNGKLKKVESFDDFIN